MTDLTQAVVHEFLNYEPHTGSLTWRQGDRRWFKSDRHWRIWNTKNAGKPAFIAKSHGHLRGAIFGKVYFAHQVIWLWMTGSWPDPQVDHENGRRTDNQWVNLREAPISGMGEISLCIRTTRVGSPVSGTSLRELPSPNPRERSEAYPRHLSNQGASRSRENGSKRAVRFFTRTRPKTTAQTASTLPHASRGLYNEKSRSRPLTAKTGVRVP
jgi:HNH endonuclease